jgi:hypothetical protein
MGWGLVAALSSTVARGVPPDEPAFVTADVDRGTRLGLGAKVVSGTVRREVAGFVALTLPLGDYAAPRQIAQAPSDDAEQKEEKEAEAAAEPEAPPVEKRAAPRPPRVIAARTLLSLARQSVVQALQKAGLPRDRLKLDGLASRSRASAALPELRLRVARSDDEALRLTPTSDDPYRYSLAGGTDLLLEATATWRLDRLLFADEEVALMRLRVERDKAEAVIAQRTLARLFAWRRALEKSRDESAEAEARAEAALEAWEAHAELDVLTDGWFSERLQELGLGDGSGSGDELEIRGHAGRNEEQPPGPSKAR